MRVAAVEHLEEHDVSDQQKIPGISKLNHFTFINGKLLARGAYAIGTGKEIVVNLSPTKGIVEK